MTRGRHVSYRMACEACVVCGGLFLCLWWMARCRIRNGLAAAEKGGKVLYNARPEWEGEEGYARMLAQAFKDLVATKDKATKPIGTPTLAYTICMHKWTGRGGRKKGGQGRDAGPRAK